MKQKQELRVVLDNIRSGENVGSILRTADAVGVRRVYLCGITPTPPHPKVTKAALGAEKSVPWEYHKQTWRLLTKLKIAGAQIVVVEQSPNSIDYRKLKPRFPLALVVGNEVHGLNKKILSLADKIIEIPMYGKKESLNVAVATGVALYKIVESRK